MKFLLPIAIALASPVSLSAGGRRLEVEIVPRFGAEPLRVGTVALETQAGQTISITRCDFLISNAALQRPDGSWVGLNNWQAYLSAGEGRKTFALTNIPAECYGRLKFHVGLPAEINHSNPAAHPAGHPLNPTVNGLHWGWQGGYVFLALEGAWRQPDGALGGFSYHLATDARLMTVELPLDLDLAQDKSVRLDFDLKDVLHDLVISTSTETTHSRADDPLAAHLCANVQRAFAVASIQDAGAARAKIESAKPLIGPNAKPYRLAISPFFPRPALPADNPLTNEGVELGRRLFNEKLLSKNQSQSCASCHDAGRGFSDTKRFSLGAEGGAGDRNAMPLCNLAWKSSYFWDGRAATLREQVLQPIENPVEMHESLPNVVRKLNDSAAYRSLFAAAFGQGSIDQDRVARALEQFLLAQVAHDSKFDRSLKGESKLSEEEQRGFELFHTEYDPARGQFGADCFHCHGGPNFQNVAFANNGLEAVFTDTGRERVTRRESDRGKFAVPSLRNVALTAPYMHDGRFDTLEQVVEHYSTGVKRSDTLDPNLSKHPKGGIPLTLADKRALVAFLKTLTEQRSKSD